MQYSYLQVLDFLTTVAFLLQGVKEGNPLVRLAINAFPNPLGGLLAVKLAAVALGIYCWRMGRDRVLTRMNWLFAIVVAWNLLSLIIGTAGRRVG
jgi:hypothetical protein